MARNSGERAAFSAADVSQRRHGTHLYVLSAHRHIKIGFSKDVKSRITSIQTGCPHRVRLIKSWRSPYARFIEKLAHTIFAKWRVAGEWFDLPPKVATSAIDLLVLAQPAYADHSFPQEAKTIVFCAACRHSSTISFVPKTDAKFRCSVCRKSSRVHVVDLSLWLTRTR